MFRAALSVSTIGFLALGLLACGGPGVPADGIAFMGSPDSPTTVLAGEESEVNFGATP